jgi:hypothetical protein
MDPLQAFPYNVTHLIVAWLEGEEDENSGGTLYTGIDRVEALQVALNAPDDRTAARDLQAWFAAKLIAVPNPSGPFAGLTRDLLNATLEWVSWSKIALAVRQQARS